MSKAVFLTLVLLPVWALAQAEPSSVAPVVPPASPPIKLENGNSYFHTNLFANMNEVERSTYNKNFVDVMEAGEPGKRYSWSIDRALGELRLFDTFSSKSGITCHRYSEWYQLGNIRQSYNGMACRKAERSWCKLRNTSTPTCELQKPGGVDGMIIDSTVKIQKLKSWWPF